MSRGVSSLRAARRDGRRTRLSFPVDSPPLTCHTRRLFSLPAPTGPMDTVIATQSLQIERKHFVVELRENPRGRFLRITEEAHGRRNTVIVPATGLNDFNSAVDEVIVAANNSAPAAP